MKSLLPSLAIANHALPSEGCIGVANDFQVLDGNWVQIAPFGDYPHPGPVMKNGRRQFPDGVMQHLDADAGQAMINEFNSLTSRIGRAVKGERPWYIGHHDVDPIKYPDPKSYAWIKELANRADGVYARVDWTPDGDELIRKKAFKYFSPYWDVTDTGKVDNEGRRIVTPKRLNSVAFTNQPNIPVMPLSNEIDGNALNGHRAMAIQCLISIAVENGVLAESDRKEWRGYFNEDFQSAAWALANADRSEAARKGWVTRRANMAAAGDKMPKAAARAAAKTMKGAKKIKGRDVVEAAKTDLRNAKRAHTQAAKISDKTGKEASDATTAHLGLRKNASDESYRASAHRLQKANAAHGAATDARIRARNNLDHAQEHHDKVMETYQKPPSRIAAAPGSKAYWKAKDKAMGASPAPKAPAYPIDAKITLPPRPATTTSANELPTYHEHLLANGESGVPGSRREQDLIQAGIIRPARKGEIGQAGDTRVGVGKTSTKSAVNTPLPKPPKVLPPLKPAAVRPQQLVTRFPGGDAAPFASASAHQIKFGHNPFL